MELKKGQLSYIYEDPFTRQKLEGIAKLIRPVKVEEDFEDWEVRFKGDLGEPTVRRRIAKK